MKARFDFNKSFYLLFTSVGVVLVQSQRIYDTTIQTERTNYDTVR